MSKKNQDRSGKKIISGSTDIRDRRRMFYIFEDLCTVNELESLAQRFEVASMLI